MNEEYRLPDWVKPGAKFRVKVGNSILYHVRAVVDGQAVCRWWRPGRGWEHKVLEPEYFDVYREHIQVVGANDTTD